MFNYALCWEFKVSGGYFNLWWKLCAFNEFVLGYRRLTFNDLADVVGIPYFVLTCVPFRNHRNPIDLARKCDSTPVKTYLETLKLGSPTWSD